MDKWKVAKVKDITSKIGSGITPRGGSSIYLDSGVPLVRSQNILDNQFSYEGLAFIDDDTAKAMSNVTLKKDDILLNITGDSVARCTQVPPNIVGGRVNQHVAIIRANKSVNSYYLKLYFVNSRVKQRMLSLADCGGTRKALTKSMIEDMEINLPSLHIQHRIAAILSSLDRKIENNRKTCEKLEEIAQAIFKRWFVDFEFPNEDGLPYKSDGGEMVYCEELDKEIPKEWKATPLEDILYFQEGPGIRNWQYVEQDGVRFINIRCIQSNDLILNTANMISKDEAYGKYSHFLVDEWDLLMSTSGTLGRYAIARKEHLPLCMNTSVIRFKPKEETGYSFMFSYLTSDEFYNHLITKGSGSVQANFGPMHLKQISLVVPQKDILGRHNDAIFPIINACMNIRKENDYLQQIRDALLPKLMSGEIAVDDIEEEV